LPLPATFEEIAQPTVEAAEVSPTGDKMVSQIFGSRKLQQKFIVTVTAGSPANEQLAVDDRLGRDVRSDLRPGVDVYLWTDPDTGQRGMAWAEATDTVVWVFGSGMNDDELAQVVQSVEVQQ
jgi:hypothetical protein